jgi:riboflavin kinase/FMN adenylyltransferase
MKIHQLLDDATPDKETVLTVGVFDGVHLGHCHLLRRLVQLSRPLLLPTVLTFSNHPITVLRPGTRVSHLTSSQQRARLIKDQGVELIVSLEFTPEFSQVSAEDFVKKLVDSLRMRGLVLGPDAALGRNRQGDFNFLRQLGADMGFWVESVEPLFLDGAVVKSRNIREGISRGEVAACAKLLDRNYSLEGQVIIGDRRGSELGFPTANLSLDSEIVLPGDGIYATWAFIDGVRYPSATSIGVRPTFGLSERLLEVHVMDFDHNIYGESMCVEFVSKLRDQETFQSVKELVHQINRDVADSRQVLAQDRRAQVA